MRARRALRTRISLAATGLLALASVTSTSATAVSVPPLTPTLLASQISGASRSNSVGTIQPTLTEVLSKPPWAFVGLDRLEVGCNPRLATWIVDNPIPCNFGPTNGATTVVLVGASHAGMWLPALIAMANQDKFQLKSFIYAGCPPVTMDFSTGLIKFEGLVVSAASCHTWNDNVVGAINALHPDVILVGGGTEAASSVPATFAAYATGMSEFVQQLTAPKKVILGSTTMRTASQETARCVNSHLTTVTACNTPYNGANPSDPTMLLLRRDQQVAKTANARLAPLISLTCTPSTKAKPMALCPPVVNHKLVYTDRSHLSSAYVTYVTPVFRSLVNSALTPSS